MPILSSFGGLAAIGRGARSGGSFSFAQTISSDIQDYTLKTAAIAAGWNQIDPLIANVTINSGVVVGASSAGVYAFDTGVTFPSGSVLSVTNNGSIVGRSGAAGTAGGGEGVGVGYSGGVGGNGGPAFRAQYAISVTNNGIVAGAGGGGGGGHGGVPNGGAGGYGRGYPYTALTTGNCKGAPADYNATYDITPAQPSASWGGNGGNDDDDGPYGAGAGGNGGDYGQSGGSGGYGGYSNLAGAAGGAAGACCSGKSYINAGAGITGTTYGTQA